MKKLLVFCVLVVVGVIAWNIASRLSPDAVGMAVGMMFGVMAGIPAALLVLAAGRRRIELDEDEDRRGQSRQSGYAYPAFPQQPPVIVLAGPPAQASSQPTVDSYGYPVRPALPGPGAGASPHARAFKVVGEKEEWIEEW